MTENVEFHYAKLVMLIDGLMRGDEFSRGMIANPEFRKMIESECLRLSQEAIKLSKSEPGEASEQTESYPPDPMELIVAGDQNEARDALKYLRDWLKGATHIIMCDPYLFMADKLSSLHVSEEKYVDHLARLVPNSAKTLRIFANGYTTKIKKMILRDLKSGREISITDTNDIHDRYIIRDKTHGKMIGTSFGGFGNRIFTILDLPTRDVERLKTLLYEIQSPA